jgi:hypothetical protein
MRRFTSLAAIALVAIAPGTARARIERTGRLEQRSKRAARTLGSEPAQRRIGVEVGPPTPSGLSDTSLLAGSVGSLPPHAFVDVATKGEQTWQTPVDHSVLDAGVVTDVTHAPEPASVGLIAAGLGLMGLTARRRRRGTATT